MPVSFGSPAERDALIHGKDATSCLIGLSLQGSDRVQLFRRLGGALVPTTVPFEPFMLLTDESKLKGWRGECRIECLAGQAGFRRLVFFPDLAALGAAKAHLQKRSGRLAGPEAPYLCFDDPVHQFLLISGMTHFQGLGFSDLRRMQIDLETYCSEGFEFPNARREADRITAIAMSDTTGWERIISGRELCEAEMLEALVAEVRARDPDVLEGHNFFRFDLNYLLLRARRYGFELELGRDRGGVKGRAARLQVGERRLNFVNHEISGRHVIDTWFLAQLHGLRTGDFDRYGLKAVARRFGVASPERTYIPGDQASWYFDHDPDTLFLYALDDVRETRAISNLLSPHYFFEAQVFPYSYQNVALANEVAKIDGLLLREYLTQRHAVPQPRNEGAESSDRGNVRSAGRAENVLRCHLIALHSSALLAKGLCPASDDLGALPRLMRRISEWRIRTRRVDPGEVQRRSEAEGLRRVCETLLGALPGYLTSSAARFKDHAVAAQIEDDRRVTLARLVERVEAQGGRVIETAGAGFSFALPPGMSSVETLSHFVRAFADVLPAGVELATKGPYRAMFTYDAENRALLDQEGRVTITGTVLRPPGLEQFQRNYLEEMLRLLLEAKAEEIPALYAHYREALQAHRFDISLLAKTETLQESLEEYQMRVKGARRRPRGIYEIALRSGRAYLEGDKLSYYVTGEGANVKVSEHCKHVSEWKRDRPDENVEYYKAKLRDCYELIRPFIAAEP